MKKEKLPERRIRVLVAIMALWGIGIGARLYFLQVVQSDSYIEKAAQHQQDIVKITPRRGDILARDGNVLARSVEVDSVFARPHEIKNRAATAKALSRLTGIPVSELNRKLDPANHWVWIKRKVSKSQRRAIEREHLRGIFFYTEFRRFYPNNDMAAHLLGYVDVDEEGKSGLEGRYNGPVRGKPGEILLLRDAHGKTYEREQTVPQVGANLTTTIDKSIQFIVEQELRAAAEKTRASAISIIVMDPMSGALLGTANWPTFNPNEYAKSPEAAYALNPSVGLTYEPGSTFKMVTIAAALEEGLTTPDEKIVGSREQLIDQPRRLPRGQATPRDHLRRELLVAARQPPDLPRRGGRQQPQPDVRGDVLVEPLGQHQPPAHPALVASQQLGDLRLREPIVAIEGAHEPRLLEVRERLSRVASPQEQLGGRAADLVDLGAQRRPAQRTRPDQPLETVDDLDRSRVPAAHDRDELAVARQRPLELTQQLGRSQPERRQLLAQLRQLDRGDRRRGEVHGATLENFGSRVDVCRDISATKCG